MIPDAPDSPLASKLKAAARLQELAKRLRRTDEQRELLADCSKLAVEQLSSHRTAFYNSKEERKIVSLIDGLSATLDSLPPEWQKIRLGWYRYAETKTGFSETALGSSDMLDTLARWRRALRPKFTEANPDRLEAVALALGPRTGFAVLMLSGPWERSRDPLYRMKRITVSELMLLAALDGLPGEHFSASRAHYDRQLNGWEKACRRADVVLKRWRKREGLPAKRSGYFG